MSFLRLLLIGIALALPFATLASLPGQAQAYDPGAPCGRDAQGNPYPCRSVSENMLEATCMTTANPYYCLPYQTRACQVNGLQMACRMASLGQNCHGGNPQACQYYLSLLRANTDCNVNGMAQACAWLRAQF